MNQRRARARSSSRAADTRTAGSRSPSSAATSSTGARRRRARVASRTLRKPWWPNPVSASSWRDGVVQPGRALERRLPVERGVDPVRQRVGGRERGRLQPAGAELEPELGLGDLVGRPQPAAAVGHVRQLDVDPFRLDAAVVGGRGHPTGVAGEVVEVAQRDLDTGDLVPAAGSEPQRTLDRSRAAGDDDREPEGCVDLGDLDVAHDEGADQVGPPLLAALAVGRDGVGQRGVPGREDRGVVDQSGPGGRQRCAHLPHSRARSAEADRAHVDDGTAAPDRSPGTHPGAAPGPRSKDAWRASTVMVRSLTANRRQIGVPRRQTPYDTSLARWRTSVWPSPAGCRW